MNDELTDDELDLIEARAAHATGRGQQEATTSTSSPPVVKTWCA